MHRIFSIVLFLAIIFIVAKDISEFIDYKLDVQLYEIMAKKYNCNFLTPSASLSNIGIFDCDGKITFKKLESN